MKSVFASTRTIDAAARRQTQEKALVRTDSALLYSKDLRHRTVRNNLDTRDGRPNRLRKRRASLGDCVSQQAANATLTAARRRVYAPRHSLNP